MSPSIVPVPLGGAGPGWKVVQAVSTTSLAPNGQYARGWEVTYQLDGGQQGTVFLAGTDLNPEAVKTAVMDAAAKLHQVINLSNGG